MYQGKISFRLVVREIEAAEPNEGGEEREAERRLSALLRGWSRGGRRFPQPRPGTKIRAPVIHSITGVVLDDFTRQLNDAGELTEVRTLAVATNSSEEIAQAIRAAEGELILALTKTGPAPSQEGECQACTCKHSLAASAL